MNELDLQLESDLRRYLDAIAAAPIPPRRGQRSQESPRVQLRLVTPDKLAVLPVEVF